MCFKYSYTRPLDCVTSGRKMKCVAPMPSSYTTIRTFSFVNGFRMRSYFTWNQHLSYLFRIVTCMLAGTDKNNEFVKSVKLSHRTIVVISNAVKQMQEGSFVFEVPYHHAKVEKSDHDVLLILLDGVTCPQ